MAKYDLLAVQAILKPTWIGCFTPSLGTFCVMRIESRGISLTVQGNVIGSQSIAYGTGAFCLRMEIKSVVDSPDSPFMAPLRRHGDGSIRLMSRGTISTLDIGTRPLWERLTDGSTAV